MTEASGKKSGSNDYDYRRDEEEMELIELLRILWKWKYLILGGAMVCGVVAAAISLSRPEFYRATMVLRPGLLTVSEYANNVYLDSAENMEALVETGTFKKELRFRLDQAGVKNLPAVLRLSVSSAYGEAIEAIRVTMQTRHAELGVAVLEHLKKLLDDKYEDRILHLKNKKDMEMNKARAKIAKCLEKKTSLQKTINMLQDRADSLRQEVKSMEDGVQRWMEGSPSFVFQNSGTDHNLFSFLGGNIIQQNLALALLGKDSLFRLELEIQDRQMQMAEMDREMDLLAAESENLQFEKNMIQIVVIDPPGISSRPLRSPIKRDIILGLVAGLFLLVLFSFFLEYLSRHINVGRH